MPKYKVNVLELLSFHNPLDGHAWNTSKIHEDEILDAIANNSTEHRSWNEVVNTLTEEESREFHINRIATLYKQELSGRIILVIEATANPVRKYFNDGNHRVVAEKLKGTKHIELIIATAEPDCINQFLPTAKLINDNQN